MIHEDNLHHDDDSHRFLDNQRASQDGVIVGETLADLILLLIEEHNLPKPEGAVLFLACGNAIQERTFLNNIVDKNAQQSPATYVDKKNPDDRTLPGTYVESDLYRFLDTNQEQFGIVTLFKGGYIIDSPENWDEFWKKISPRCQQNAYIIVAPHNETGGLKKKIPAEAGFKVLVYDSNVLIAIKQS